MKHKDFDCGREFDWGKTSEHYAMYRDVYPEEFYRRVLEAGIGLPGQKILDLGTGTGVLPRNMARFGAEFTGVDLSENQIAAARQLTQRAGLSITYQVCGAEDIDFPPESFDAVTACQCFGYFDKGKLLPKIHRMLKPGGKLGVFFMSWLPEEDPLAAASESLVLRYNPNWTGAGMKRHTLSLPEWGKGLFETETAETFDFRIPFTRESWNGRILACRGVEAALSPEEVSAFDREHRALLEQTAPEKFTVLHFASVLVLGRKELTVDN